MRNEKIRKGSVLLVAVTAAVVSFWHIRHLALTHGGDRLSSVLLPVAIDGTVVAATLSMLEATGIWQNLARVMLILSVGLTLAANVAYGWASGPWGGILWAWPAVAFFGCAELAIGMARHAAPAKAKPARRATAKELATGISWDEQMARHAAARDAAAAKAGRAPRLEAVPDEDEAARQKWLAASAEAGRPVSDRKMAELHPGRSRMYWTPRIKQWKEMTA